MPETDYSCDYLKPLDVVYEPDRRNAGTYSARLIGEAQDRERKVDDFHARIAQYELIDLIPVDVRVQFETAKNLYLYAWFVYRFFNVAEQHAFTTLEFGLRELFKDDLRALPKKSKYKRGGHSYLPNLLQYAIDHDYIQNDDFERYRRSVWLRAKERYESEKHREMEEKGLKEIALIESEIEIKLEDHYDYLGTLPDRLRRLRNGYAHGSKKLDNLVIGAFEQVSEILNAAYQRKLRDT